jgi:uncharacterized protein (TIGR00297 family)
MPLQSAGLSLAGAVAAAGVAATAWKARALTGPGALAAAAVGGATMAAGWKWGMVLLVFFTSSSVLSRLGQTPRGAASARFAAKTGARDASQVLANGGVFAACTLIGAATASPVLTAASLGALAVANGDTWATEVGVVFGGTPRSVVSWQPLPAGSSGAVSLVGTLAGVAGILLIAVAAAALHIHPGQMNAIMAGGLCGFLADSILGATVQSQRWCDQCREYTERLVHTCGTETAHKRGAHWLTNDGVNLAATVIGAVIAGIIAA